MTENYFHFSEVYGMIAVWNTVEQEPSMSLSRSDSVQHSGKEHI